MRKFLLGISLMALLSGPGRAEQFNRELGFGLTYLRAASIPADLPTEMTLSDSVLDLRYATGDAGGAKALRSWLSQHATATTPVLILINNATSIDLLRQMAFLPALPGVLTLGSVGGEFSPDIVVHTNPEQERRAYSALHSIADIVKLITSVPTKIRRDEATILAAKDRGESIPDESGMNLTDEPGPAPESAPLIDSALQRAVQIHRAWVVLQSSKS